MKYVVLFYQTTTCGSTTTETTGELLLHRLHLHGMFSLPSATGLSVSATRLKLLVL